MLVIRDGVFDEIDDIFSNVGCVVGNPFEVVGCREQVECGFNAVRLRPHGMDSLLFQEVRKDIAAIRTDRFHRGVIPVRVRNALTEMGWRVPR